jgi:hypothetical protein
MTKRKDFVTPSGLSANDPEGMEYFLDAME